MEKCGEEEEATKGLGNQEDVLSENELKLLDLISEIIINVSIKEYNEKKSD